MHLCANYFVTDTAANSPGIVRGRSVFSLIFLPFLRKRDDQSKVGCLFTFWGFAGRHLEILSVSYLRWHFMSAVQYLYNTIFGSKLTYKMTTLQRNYRKMTMNWSFSYNAFVKLHGKKIWEPQHDFVISKTVTRCVIKGLYRICKYL